MKSALIASIAAMVFGAWAFPAAAEPRSSHAESDKTLEIAAAGIAVRLSKDGAIASVAFGGLERQVAGGTSLAGCSETAPAAISPLPGGGIEVVRALGMRAGDGSCRVVERFTPGVSSVRWEVEVLGDGGPWSTAIETRLAYPARETHASIWAPWSDPGMKPAIAPWDAPGPWTDPLVPKPFTDAVLYYGAVPFSSGTPFVNFTPLRGDLLGIPMASVLERDRDLGLSVILSPEDPTLDMTLTISPDVGLCFSRTRHRISAAAPVRFALDLVPHEGDWRGGLRWMVERYPGYFDPPNPAADAMAGTGAYSSHEGPIDTAKMRAMAFRVNWKASFDFPYMGMFIPPVASDSEAWTRFGGGKTSVGAMEAYARRMRAMGFFVLSYFNATEFGTRIAWPPTKPAAPGDAGLWKDPNAFLFGRLGGAVLRIPPQVGPKELALYPKPIHGGPYYTWEDGIATDCGDPAYRAFLLEQVRRHLERLPDASGFCIDRTDWLRLYNTERDDGRSWFEGKPAAFLLNSWKSFLEEMGPMVHRAGKVIFVNNHDKRLDLLRHADGIFDEFSFDGRALNLNALLAVRKTAIGWTHDEGNLRPDPDAFFQRCLYLGVYPMAPFPDNDHSILPGAWAERQYRDYGPLLDAMRGKKWVLAAHAVGAPGGAAKVNLFQVPGGYAAPVTFAGGAPFVVIEIRAPISPGATAEALLPGKEGPIPVDIQRLSSSAMLRVPVAHGCAMVRISDS